MTALVIANTSVRQDAAGRFSLNDLHRAAGGEKRHQPRYWLANRQAKDLVAAIGDSGIPLSVVRGGPDQGTYVCDDLVIAYATWVSPKFYLRVIRAYKALTGNDLRENVSLLGKRLALEVKDSSSKGRASFGSRLMNERRRELPAINDERMRLENEMQQGLFGRLPGAAA